MNARRLRCAGLAAVLAAACGGDDGELRLVGSVERTLMELVAPVSEVIVEVAVARGERVEPGKLLVRLDPTLAEAEIARAEASLAGARTGARVSEQDLARALEMQRRSVASQQDLERAELQRDEAAARLREAEAVLAAARKRMADLALASPVRGVVDQIPFDVGERVPAGAVLVVVTQDAEPWVRVWIPEDAVARVAPGGAAEVRIDGVEGPLRGRVLDVSREPEFTPHYALTERERVHLVYEARVGIDDAPGALRPGVPAEVTLARDGEAR
jgi:HlyD family secretion protein